MIRRLFRKLFRLVLVLGAAAAVYKVAQARKPSPALPEGDAWPPTPKQAPKPPERAQAAPASAPNTPVYQAPVAPPTGAAGAAGAAAATAATAAAGAEVPAKPNVPAAKKATANASAPWVDPVDGSCPTTHPLKAKMTSLIYHLPGMTAYARTRPDRCYRDEDAAQADGLRKAKR